MQRRDIIIIGAGPAGLSTALHLARDFPHLASRILILDKARHPRPKLCAGGLVPDVDIILNRLGLDSSEVPHVNAASAHFDFAGKGLDFKIPKRHAIRVIRRDEFDGWLANKTKLRGIEIREGVAVKDVRPDAEGVTIAAETGEFRAQVVVGADGSKGVTRGCVLPGEPIRMARVLEALAPAGQPGEAQIPNVRHKANEAYFDFLPVPLGIDGYVWDFPTQVKGRPMRCWGVYDANLNPNGGKPPLKATLAEEMSRHGFNLDDHRLEGHPIRWFEPGTKMSVPRVLLAGDAAGADSLFGEGISPALGYGALAAREIGEAFERGEFSFRGYGRRVARSGLGQTLTARWLLAQIALQIRQRWFQNFFWRYMQPVTRAVIWIFILYWSRRLPKPRQADMPAHQS